MKRKWIFFVAPPAAVLFIGAFGFLIQHLWNWLLPALFAGAHLITFWQALGLLLLCRILFGSWGAGKHRGDRRKWRAGREQWQSMSPEEREQFRQSMRARCGTFTPQAAEPTRPA
jgi:hypothetical protein